MWTYEEAVRAKQLVFALNDGFYSYKADAGPSGRRVISVVWQSLAINPTVCELIPAVSMWVMYMSLSAIDIRTLDRRSSIALRALGAGIQKQEMGSPSGTIIYEGKTYLTINKTGTYGVRKGYIT